MPGARNPDPEYVAARRVLLDAFAALGTHRKAVVLIGAQAIYLHVGEGDLAVAPYTTDGDLAIDPRELDDEPALAAALEAAGFKLAVRPGTWTMSEVQIDLLVPASLGGAGRRGARLGVHGTEVARKATQRRSTFSSSHRTMHSCSCSQSSRGRWRGATSGWRYSYTNSWRGWCRLCGRSG